jgi:hypothetical protein
LTSPNKESIYIITKSHQIIRVDNLIEGNGNDKKVIPVPEGLDLAQVKLKQIQNLFGHFVLIAEDGRRWSTNERLVPDNIEGVAVQSFALADQTAFWIDANGQLYTNMTEDKLDLNWSIRNPEDSSFEIKRSLIVDTIRGTTPDDKFLSIHIGGSKTNKYGIAVVQKATGKKLLYSFGSS